MGAPGPTGPALAVSDWAVDRRSEELDDVEPPPVTAGVTRELVVEPLVAVVETADVVDGVVVRT